jgi:hypothetical protein
VRRFRLKLCSLVLDSDTTVPRVLLAGIALIWAIGLALPGDTFDRPVYRYMAMIASEQAWAICWSVYGVALLYRTFSERNAFKTDLALNFFGLIIYSTTLASIIATRIWPFPAGVGPDVGCAMLAFWVFTRTHVNSLGGWRNG